MIFKNALVSVSDKTGLVDFLKPLVDQGLRVVSTGGTAKYLRENQVPVVEVSEQTDFPEVMDGRVRTLHPKIHIPILARESHKEDTKLLKELDLEPFDLVIGNLYPFEKKLNQNLNEDQQVEFIDIGGPSLLRAAAKNYQRIVTLIDPNDYSLVLDKNDLEFRRHLASKVFKHISMYDDVIAQYLSKADNLKELESFSISAKPVKSLRYGENAQQDAQWYSLTSKGLHNAEILQGKELSYNNLLDINSALRTLRDFSEKPTVVSVKHNNPCGVATSDNLFDATERSLKADPVSVFGGVVALSHEVNEIVAKELTSLFLECVVAPGFSEGAIKILAKKKNLRVLKLSNILEKTSQREIRSIDGGLLIQSSDQVYEWQSSWKIYGVEPNMEQKQNLAFIWKVCAHLKSNAIAIGSDFQSLGLGMGQVNRVDAVKQAIERMKTFHSREKHKDLFMASDAFFPFADSIELAKLGGINWIIQPGGSIKDQEVIEKAKELGISMVLTNQRHFYH